MLTHSYSIGRLSLIVVFNVNHENKLKILLSFKTHGSISSVQESARQNKYHDIARSTFGMFDICVWGIEAKNVIQ